MDSPFLGMIATFAFNFAPRGWAFCDGQIVSIAQNTALFSLMGTTYGGDGQTTFALPDLRGRVALHPGQGPGLPNYVWGESGGATEVTLLQSNMPPHNHTLSASTQSGTDDIPMNNFFATIATGYTHVSPDTVMGMNSIGVSGQGVPFSIMQPYLAVYHCIALQGIFPSRN